MPLCARGASEYAKPLLRIKLRGCRIWIVHIAVQTQKRLASITDTQYMHTDMHIRTVKEADRPGRGSEAWEREIGRTETVFRTVRKIVAKSLSGLKVTSTECTKSRRLGPHVCSGRFTQSKDGLICRKVEQCQPCFSLLGALKPFRLQVYKRSHRDNQFEGLKPEPFL